jgi:archaellum biogenesis ATPase FlaH
MAYIGKIFDKDFNFPIEEKLKIVFGENGSGKTLALRKLASYFIEHGENVLYFPSERIFTADPETIRNAVYGLLVNKKLCGEDPYKKYGFVKSSIEYDLDHLEQYHNQYITSGIIQWVNFFGNIVSNADKEVIVIIDSPERSLHIRVQRNFVDDILELSNVKKLIICTHDPSMLGNHGDVATGITHYVDLYGE